MNGTYQIAKPANEAVLNYKTGSPERSAVVKWLQAFKQSPTDVKMYIGGEWISSAETLPIYAPHNHKLLLGHYHQGGVAHIEQAIRAALGAKPSWEQLPFERRAAVFLRAADLLSTKYRAKINAATMLGQSKSVHQAEIDAACELIDFFRYNCYFAQKIYTDQPESDASQFNRLEYRPLEGFVYAVSPFNFTSIAANLAAAPALMGNTVVWKPSASAALSAGVIMELLAEAGLPAGVINMVFAEPVEATNRILSDPDFAGLHFTGSTEVFKSIWKKAAQNLDVYKSFPRLVGETGGKDFVLMHPSADPKQVAVALVRGAFEYQGQKCSAASRAYIPYNMYQAVITEVQNQLEHVKIGAPDDFGCFFNAVINRNAYNRLSNAIEEARKSPLCKIVAGGDCDDTNGFFIEPTIIVTEDPNYITMREELFGPVLTIYRYSDDRFDEVLELIDTTSAYALTGAIFANDAHIINYCEEKLRYAAGNFYINDKPTGAVVGRQPFGGGRASGTNDKAGSLLNLLRWVSPRAIKETYNPPTSIIYPFME